MSTTIITEATDAVQSNNAEWDVTSQKRRDALAFFERSARNCTYPKLNAYRESDRSFFPEMIYMLATRGLIATKVLRRVLDDAWMTCPRTSMPYLSKWVELFHLANEPASV